MAHAAIRCEADAVGEEVGLPERAISWSILSNIAFARHLHLAQADRIRLDVMNPELPDRFANLQ